MFCNVTAPFVLIWLSCRFAEGSFCAFWWGQACDTITMMSLNYTNMVVSAVHLIIHRSWDVTYDCLRLCDECSMSSLIVGRNDGDDIVGRL